MLSKALQHYTKESSPVLRSFGRLVQEKTPCYKLFEIYRFNPDKDIKPHMERYAVDLSESLLSATSIVDVAECSWTASFTSRPTSTPRSPSEGACC